MSLSAMSRSNVIVDFGIVINNVIASTNILLKHWYCLYLVRLFVFFVC